MNTKQIIYLIYPFVLGFVAKELMSIPDTGYWFYVWVLCLLSIFIFVKLILPYNERKFDAINAIDYESALKEKNVGEKPYTYAVGLHMIVLVIIIIQFFINL